MYIGLYHIILYVTAGTAIQVIIICIVIIRL